MSTYKTIGERKAADVAHLEKVLGPDSQFVKQLKRNLELDQQNQKDGVKSSAQVYQLGMRKRQSSPDEQLQQMEDQMQQGMKDQGST